MIPAANIRDLVLKDEVVQAVKEGMFHIYPITSIDEGIALLMGKEAGVRDQNGCYPADSVHGRVHAKLKSFWKYAEGEEV